MSRLGRYWLFFVIVAVGLALSWGQVGRNTQRLFDERPVVYLSTEAGCDPRLAPCAATTGDRALVLGPAGSGLRIKQAGLRETAVTRAVVVFLDGAGGEIEQEALVRGSDDWRIPRLPARARVVRLQFVTGDEMTVADFPIQSSSGDPGR